MRPPCDLLQFTSRLLLHHCSAETRPACSPLPFFTPLTPPSAASPPSRCISRSCGLRRRRGGAATRARDALGATPTAKLPNLKPGMELGIVYYGWVIFMGSVDVRVTFCSPVDGLGGNMLERVQVRFERSLSANAVLRCCGPSLRFREEVGWNNWDAKGCFLVTTGAQKPPVKVSKQPVGGSWYIFILISVKHHQ